MLRTSSNNSVFIWFLICLIILSNLNKVEGIEYPFITYLKYTIPAICFLYFVIKKKYYFHKQVIPLLLILFVSLFNLLSITGDGWKDYFFIFCTIVPFFVLSRKDILSIDIVRLNFLVFFTFTIKVALNFQSIRFFDISKSSALFEDHIFGFIFGFFIIYFFPRKKWLLVIINSIFLFITLKRIVLLGLIIVTVFYFTRKLKYINVTSAIILNLVTVYFLIMFGAGEFDDVLISTVEQGSSEFSQGRSYLYDEVLTYLNNSDFFKILLTGKGLGTTYDYTLLGTPVNLHSDLLKLFVELGALSYAYFIYFLYKVNKTCLQYTIYINTVFISDNILIYLPVMFIYTLLSIFESD